MSTDGPVREIEYRRLAPAELFLVGEIDRTERIEGRYVQDGTRLELQVGDWSSPPGIPTGTGSIRSPPSRWLSNGTWKRARSHWAFDGELLVGIGLVTHSPARPSSTPLSVRHRGRGLGVRLADQESIAREAGDTAMVVSATPSANTVRFYLGRGYEPTAEPLPELYELEPEDVRMQRRCDCASLQQSVASA